jgi:transcriptional regulator GlxA family with amidase domain
VSGVSEAHFARSFKQAFGVPPHRYLLTRRIERATALLRDTDLAITEIAFPDRLGKPGTFGRILPRHHRREPERQPGPCAGAWPASSAGCRTASSAPPTGPASK